MAVNLFNPKTVWLFSAEAWNWNLNKHRLRTAIKALNRESLARWNVNKIALDDPCWCGFMSSRWKTFQLAKTWSIFTHTLTCCSSNYQALLELWLPVHTCSNTSSSAFRLTAQGNDKSKGFKASKFDLWIWMGLLWGGGVNFTEAIPWLTRIY